MLLSACALDSGASDPPVTPDTTIPSTLRVSVMVAENQDASDGVYGSSDVTVQFSTNEITTPPNTVIFTHGEEMQCLFNNQRTQPIPLGGASDYRLHVRMGSIPITYECDYLYTQNGTPESSRIFNFTNAPMLLSPLLVRPITNPASIEVSYIPGNPTPLASPCMVQATANESAPASNGGTIASVTGGTEQQSGSIPNRSVYTKGLNISTFVSGGTGNVVMTRTCTPCKFDHHNSADDRNQVFDAVDVTYTTTASDEVTWVL